MPRLLAEPGERGGAHALEIAAIGRPRKIEREDVVLRERKLELNRAEGLLEFGAEAARRGLEQPRHLHRDRRAAGNDPAIARPLKRRAHHGDGIAARMMPEAPVLIGEQHLDIER